MRHSERVTSVSDDPTNLISQHNIILSLQTRVGLRLLLEHKCVIIVSSAAFPFLNLFSAERGRESHFPDIVVVGDDGQCDQIGLLFIPTSGHAGGRRSPTFSLLPSSLIDKATATLLNKELTPVFNLINSVTLLSRVAVALLVE